MRLYREDRINSDLKEPLVETESNKSSRYTSTNKSSTNTSGQIESEMPNPDKNNTKSGDKSKDTSSSKDGNDSVSSKRNVWGRSRSKNKRGSPSNNASTLSIAFVTLSLVVWTQHAKAQENDQILSRLGNALVEGRETGCQSLQNRDTLLFELKDALLDKNCFMVPGTSLDLYRLEILGAAPDKYMFHLIEIEGKGYRTTPGSWDETTQGTCANWTFCLLVWVYATANATFSPYSFRS